MWNCSDTFRKSDDTNNPSLNCLCLPIKGISTFSMILRSGDAYRIIEAKLITIDEATIMSVHDSNGWEKIKNNRWKERLR